MMQKEKNERSTQLITCLENSSKLIMQSKKKKETMDKQDSIKVYANNQLFQINVPQNQVTCGWLLEQVLKFLTLLGKDPI